MNFRPDARTVIGPAPAPEDRFKIVGVTSTGLVVKKVKLLEFNRPPYHPWLTVALAEEEIAIQAASEDSVWQGEGWED